MFKGQKLIVEKEKMYFYYLFTNNMGQSSKSRKNYINLENNFV